MRGEFYKMDFRAWNMGTVELTLEQEAAYLRLCHAMYDVGGPVPNSTRFLQAIFRCGNVKAASLVKQLVAAGKIAITADDELFNHRVAEELRERERVSSARRTAGERGGSAPRVGNDCPPSGNRVDAEWMPSDGRVTARKPLRNKDQTEAIASMPQSREEKKREEVNQEEGKPLPDPQARSDFPPQAFELFWERQRHKVGKDAAQRAFDRVRRSRRVAFAELMAGLDRYIATKPATREWCNPSTWLNEGRWADQPAEPTAQARASPGHRPPSAQQRALDRAAQAHRRLTEDDDGKGPFGGNAPTHPAGGGYRNGHAHAALHESPGGRPRLAPPRLAGPPRPH